MKTSAIILGLIPSAILGSIAGLIIDENLSAPTPIHQSAPTQITNNPPADYLSSDDINRLNQMSKLLNSPGNNYSEYRKLCNLATTKPYIGMTRNQAHASTWCIPYNRTTTTDSHGIFIQEIYLKCPECLAAYSDRKYLYFLNDILVSIHE